MTSYATKLIEINENNVETIAEQRYNNVKMNPRTPSYHSLPAEEAKNRSCISLKISGNSSLQTTRSRKHRLFFPNMLKAGTRNVFL